MPDKIVSYAEKYHVSSETMAQIVRCESYGDPLAIGDKGHSFGLVQIYEPAHPEVSKQEALDVDFSLNFLALNLAKGNGKIWTCFSQTQE